MDFGRLANLFNKNFWKETAAVGKLGYGSRLMEHGGKMRAVTTAKGAMAQGIKDLGGRGAAQAARAFGLNEISGIGKWATYGAVAGGLKGGYDWATGNSGSGFIGSVVGGAVSGGLAGGAIRGGAALYKMTGKVGSWGSKASGALSGNKAVMGGVLGGATPEFRAAVRANPRFAAHARSSDQAAFQSMINANRAATQNTTMSTAMRQSSTAGTSLGANGSIGGHINLLSQHPMPKKSVSRYPLSREAIEAEEAASAARRQKRIDADLRKKGGGML